MFNESVLSRIVKRELDLIWASLSCDAIDPSILRAESGLLGEETKNWTCPSVRRGIGLSVTNMIVVSVRLENVKPRMVSNGTGSMLCNIVESRTAYTASRSNRVVLSRKLSEAFS